MSKDSDLNVSSSSSTQDEVIEIVTMKSTITIEKIKNETNDIDLIMVIGIIITILSFASCIIVCILFLKKKKRDGDEYDTNKKNASSNNGISSIPIPSHSPSSQMTPDGTTPRFPGDILQSASDDNEDNRSCSNESMYDKEDIQTDGNTAPHVEEGHHTYYH